MTMHGFEVGTRELTASETQCVGGGEITAGGLASSMAEGGAVGFMVGPMVFGFGGYLIGPILGAGVGSAFYFAGALVDYCF
jgi:hypothetical protein